MVFIKLRLVYNIILNLNKIYCFLKMVYISRIEELFISFFYIIVLFYFILLFKLPFVL